MIVVCVVFKLTKQYATLIEKNGLGFHIVCVSFLQLF